MNQSVSDDQRQAKERRVVIIDGESFHVTTIRLKRGSVVKSSAMDGRRLRVDMYEPIHVDADHGTLHT